MRFPARSAPFLTFLGLLLAAAPATRGESVATGSDLALTLHARDLVPGDLVRVQVAAPVPVARVTGTLRGESLDFVSGCPGSAACATWSAWAALDLDWAPGDIKVTARATTDAGAALAGATTFALRAKSFPQQELKVEGKYVDPPKAAQERIARDNAKLGKVYALRSPVPPPEGAWVRPVPGEPTGVFGARRVFNGQKRKPHSGLDLRAPTGTPVMSSGPGTVALAADLYFSGNTVIVDHGGGMFTIYAHLSSMSVKEGDAVQAGERVGLSGATGRVTGPHLHWGGKVGSRIFDPTSLLDPALSRD